MNQFKLRTHDEPISQERRRPNLSLVDQNRRYKDKHNGDIMSETSQYYLYYLFVGSMPLGCMIWYYKNEIAAIVGL